MRIAIDRVHVRCMHGVGLSYYLLLLVNQTIVLLDVKRVTKVVVLTTEMMMLILLQLHLHLVLLQVCWMRHQIRLMLKAVHLILVELLLLLLHL